jgi:hypothetical protein
MNAKCVNEKNINSIESQNSKEDFISSSFILIKNEAPIIPPLNFEVTGENIDASSNLNNDKLNKYLPNELKTPKLDKTRNAIAGFTPYNQISNMSPFISNILDTPFGNHPLQPKNLFGK